MRVRPFFWCLLAVTCIGVLVFAATIHRHIPAVMQVHIDQQTPASIGFTTLELHLTDSQGLPIEQAQVIPSARMTNMYMVTNASTVRELGQGNYAAQLQLYMAGPWEIRIIAQADGFDLLQQTLLVQVQ
jgi:YtkA-like